MDNVLTLGQLAENLNKFFVEHPEFKDKEASHAVECGYSGAGFLSPFTIAVPILANGGYGNFVKIVSDDDGFETNRFIKEWKFFRVGGEP